MNISRLVLPALLGFLLFPASALASSEEDAANRDRVESLLAEMDCSGKKARLFYDYLTSSASLQGTLKFRCAKGKENITPPTWLAAEVSSMTARGIRVGRGKSPEIELWGEPLVILGEFNDLVLKTAPQKSGGAGLSQKFIAEGCRELLGRLDKAVGLLGKAGPSCSFEKRGELVYAAYLKALAELDGLESSFGIVSPLTFFEKSAAVMAGAEEAFSALFGEQPQNPVCGRFQAAYLAVPRLSEGMRALTLPFDYHQLAGIKRGDRVDLMVTNDYSASSGKDTITATIIQAAPVLDIYRPQEPGSAAKASLTLMLSPVQAQYAALASVQGRGLSVALRAAGDNEPRAIEAASFKKIIK